MLFYMINASQPQAQLLESSERNDSACYNKKGSATTSTCTVSTENSQSISKTMISSSSNHHRTEEPSLSESSEDHRRHNYSVTCRWEQRLVKWKAWEDRLNDKELSDSLAEIPPPTCQDLFLDPAVQRDVYELSKKLMEFEEEFTRYAAFDISANKENAGSSQGNERKRMLESLKKSVKVIRLSIHILKSEHKIAKDLLAANSYKGNENLTENTQTTLKSLDDQRFDNNKVPSPSRATQDVALPIPENMVPALLVKLSDNMKASLRSFQRYVAALFEVAKETKAKNEDGKKMVKATCEAILGWKENQLFESVAKYGRPPTDSDSETDVDQPILHALVCRIIEMIADHEESDGDDEAVLPLADQGVTMEHQIRGTRDDFVKEHRIDITVQPHTEHLALRLATLVHLPVEIKSAKKKTKAFKRNLEKGRSQTVGHLAKKLTHAFHFGGAGVNASTIGVSLTQASIEVILLKLSGIGTSAIDVVGESTGSIPLGIDPKLEDFHKESFTGSNETLSGFELLAGALMYAGSKGILYDDMKISQVSPQERLTVEYLGCGAFSNVFELQGKDGQFMKIPLSASQEKSLEHEAKILEKLENSNVEGVPKLVYSEALLSDIRATMRDEVSEMKGLRLQGLIGVPLSKVQKPFWKKNWMITLKKVCEALRAAHSCCVYHLDVQPGNIIVDPSTNEVMLSDWGCATVEKKLTSFRGCTPYAHDSLLGKKFDSVPVNATLDFASLAYTVVHVTKGKLPWFAEFDHPTYVGKDSLERRRDDVTKFIQEKKEEAAEEGFELPKALLEAIAGSQRNTRKGAVPTVATEGLRRSKRKRGAN